MVDEPTYLTPAELRARLREKVSIKTLTNWRRGVGGPGPKFTRVGNSVLYDVADVIEWEKSIKFGSTQEYQGAKSRPRSAQP